MTIANIPVTVDAKGRREPTLAELRIELDNALRLERVTRDYINAWRRVLSEQSRDRLKLQREITRRERSAR